MKNHFQLIFLFSFFIWNNSFCCDCPSFPPLDNKTFESADLKKIVFKGKVLKTGECGDELGSCVFEVQELYMGTSTRQIAALFDCTSSCAMNFFPGEEWIIYGEYAQPEKIKVSFCSRSRKISLGNSEEIDRIAYGATTAEEIAFLREKVGLKVIRRDEIQRDLLHKNEMPTAWQKVFLLGGSIVFMVIFLIIVKRFFK